VEPQKSRGGRVCGDKLPDSLLECKIKARSSKQLLNSGRVPDSLLLDKTLQNENKYKKIMVLVRFEYYLCDTVVYFLCVCVCVGEGIKKCTQWHAAVDQNKH
jgi:hypothetical protein